jgi:sugar phosphate isomerase/epimerase
MKRRQFLETAIGAVLASQAGAIAFAESGPVRPTAAAPVHSLQAGDRSSPKLAVEAYSRFLQWLRTPDDVAEAVLQLGSHALDITVRPYPGHVDPARVRQELPRFVKGLQKHGVRVTTMATPIADADSPHAEEILSTASSVGITHYWGGTFRYDLSKPVMPQLDALKPRVEKIAALNAKYKMTGMYHTYAFPMSVGCAVWDLLYVLRDFDPAHVGIHYDTSHMVNAQILGGWEVSLLAAGPYIRGLSIKDSYIEKGGMSGGRRGRGGPRGRGGNRAPAWTPPWSEHYTPLGQGSVPLPHFAQIIKEMNFSGPVEIQVEYPDGGAENGLGKISLPREQVLAPIRKDFEFLRGIFRNAGLA